jgi:hypothetical protein
MDTTDVAVAAGALKYFKWCPLSELMFAKASYSNKTYIRTRETFEVKWLRVIDDVSSRTIFNEQGFQLKSGSLHSKVKSMLAGYAKSHATRNLSALPDIDDISALDSVLKDMSDAIEKLADECQSEKKSKKKK